MGLLLLLKTIAHRLSIASRIVTAHPMRLSIMLFCLLVAFAFVYLLSYLSPLQSVILLILTLIDFSPTTL